jgi:nitronate monooxygenase
VLAHLPSGEPIVPSEPAPPMVGTTGEIEALSLWAGQSVALAKRSQPAAEIVAELVAMVPATSTSRTRRLTDDSSD